MRVSNSRKYTYRVLTRDRGALVSIALATVLAVLAGEGIISEGVAGMMSTEMTTRARTPAADATLSTPAASAINLADFGADPTGEEDSTAAINAFFDAIPDGGEGRLPPGTYSISSTIRLVGRRSIRVVGEGGGLWGGVKFQWDGTSEGTVFDIDQVSHAFFERFSILPGSSTIGVCIKVNKRDPAVNTSTDNHFAAILCYRPQVAGFQIGKESSTNNELHTFTDVEVWCENDRADGLQIYQTNSKFHRIIGSSFVDCGRGIYVESGSFHAWNTNFGYNGTDVHLGSPSDTIGLYSPQSEGTRGKFLVCDGKTGAAWAVTVQNGRLAPATASAVGERISCFNKGPLVLMNNDFADGQHHPGFRVRAETFQGGATLVSIGNVYPTNEPFVTGKETVLTSLGDVGWVSAELNQPLPPAIPLRLKKGKKAALLLYLTAVLASADIDSDGPGVFRGAL